MRSSNFRKRESKGEGPSGEVSIICNRRYLISGDRGSKASRAAQFLAHRLAEQVQDEIDTWFLARYVILQIGV